MKLVPRLIIPIRAVEDDHVDRLGVEVQRCMELTSTNSSIGLFLESQSSGDCLVSLVFVAALPGVFSFV